MNITDETEGIIYDWIMMLPEDDQRQIINADDVLECINEEAEEEIKNEIWELLKSNINYGVILHRLKIYLSDVIETDVSSSEDEKEVMESSESE